MSVNHVLLIGRLGADPELRHTATGKTLCRFSLATDRRRREGVEERPDWHRVVAWERTAENCHRFLSKGRQVAVEGRLQTRRWEDDAGKTRWTTEVVAFRVEFLGGKGTDSSAPAVGGEPPAAPLGGEEPAGDPLPF